VILAVPSYNIQLRQSVIPRCSQEEEEKLQSSKPMDRVSSSSSFKGLYRMYIAMRMPVESRAIIVTQKLGTTKFYSLSGLRTTNPLSIR
jgi:hypothetical protein